MKVELVDLLINHFGVKVVIVRGDGLKTAHMIAPVSYHKTPNQVKYLLKVAVIETVLMAEPRQTLQPTTCQDSMVHFNPRLPNTPHIMDQQILHAIVVVKISPSECSCPCAAARSSAGNLAASWMQQPG